MLLVYLIMIALMTIPAKFDSLGIPETQLGAVARTNTPAWIYASLRTNCE